MSDDIAIELRRVVKLFGDVRAVDDINLRIRDGEFFSLLGPSGCGKTTTLRMIAGFEYPTQGEILLHGRSIGSTPPYERNVNTVFQSYALFPHMSVADNVAFGREMKRVPPTEIVARVQQALDLVRLAGYDNRRPRQLSGGQQQRVALARALVNQPEVLLLDEPLGALDQKLRKEMQLELKNIQERLGITFIFVTHDQEEALTMSDRIAVMNHGKVLQIGTPTEVYERPSCRFVADFIGETNFLNGRVAELGAALPGGGKQVALTTDDGLTVRGISMDAITLGAQVAMSVRPEKVYLTQAPPPNGAENRFDVTVERVAYIGSDTRLLVRLGERLVSVWEQNTRSTLDRDAYWQAGEQGHLWWPYDNALVLAE
jgi:spermidine/putrescine transport system ATP-binding protein